MYVYVRNTMLKMWFQLSTILSASGAAGSSSETERTTKKHRKRGKGEGDTNTQSHKRNMYKTFTLFALAERQALHKTFPHTHTHTHQMPK